MTEEETKRDFAPKTTEESKPKREKKKRKGNKEDAHL